MGYSPHCWNIGGRRGGLAYWAVAMRLGIGCGLGFVLSCQSDTVLMRRGAPALVTAGQGRLRLAAWDPATNSLAEVGWVDAASATGLTLVDFDWGAEH